MKDYQRHIVNTHLDHEDEALCGAKLSRMEWVFISIDHAFISTPKDRMQPCPECAQEVVRVFSKVE